jgi:hypothetical protein
VASRACQFSSPSKIVAYASVYISGVIEREATSWISVSLGQMSARCTGRP